MAAWTNLTWPDDPYRTGQQLYRKPVPRLAAYTVWPSLTDGRAVPAAAAVVYLPLHRTRPVTVSPDAVAFGFRAVSATSPQELPQVTAVADLDLMQARRHAAILAGYHLAQDLAALQPPGPPARRGISAVAADWTIRAPAAGLAALFDCELDLPGEPSLGRACQLAGITLTETGPAWPAERHPALLAVERALAVALVCARHHGRYEWPGVLDTQTLMTAAAWDCLPWPQAAEGGRAAQAAGPGRQQ